MIPESEWIWYGFAGHFCCSYQCRYHLCTRIGNYLVSTIGAYFPDAYLPMERIGPDPGDLYETIVFTCNGEDADGNPIQGSRESAATRSTTSSEARGIHREACRHMACLPQTGRLFHETEQ